MTEVDELLARLRKLPALPLDGEFKASVQARARRRVARRTHAPMAALTSLVLGVTVVSYLGWALQFTSALYR